MHPLLLPGFNDSGAHLTNMAFYDCNLRAIKIAAEGGLHDAAYMVKRLTKDVSELFNLGVGVLERGAHADLTMIDPMALQAYDGEGNVKRIYRDIFEHEQLVNRSDGVVPLVLINGRVAWRDTDFGSSLGETPMGRLITAA